jgi:GH24 family phage-related lysozyme (muramidase)
VIQEAISILKKFEGFSSTAYYDVNAYRIGYGSDTITNLNGTFKKVTSTDRINQQQADLDLARRIPQFEKVIINQVGSDAWNKLPDQAKASLISFAYNYGSIAKKSLRDAIKGGNLNTIADTLIESTLNDNKKLSSSARESLKNRRRFEAEQIRTAKKTIAQPIKQGKKLIGLFLLSIGATILYKKLKK